MPKGKPKLAEASLQAQLEFLAWRDSQMLAISTQLEDALPDLLSDLREYVDNAGIGTLAWSSASLKKTANGALAQWSKQQTSIALERAEAELEDAITHLPPDIRLNADIWEQLSEAAPALGGVGLIALSLAAIPTVVSFATVSTSIFAFWGSAAVSWPLFAVGAVGISAATLLGSQSLTWAQQKARNNLWLRLEAEAGKQILGLSQHPTDRCLLNDIQAAVLRAGLNKIGNMV